MCIQSLVLVVFASEGWSCCAVLCCAHMCCAVLGLDRACPDRGCMLSCPAVLTAFHPVFVCLGAFACRCACYAGAKWLHHACFGGWASDKRVVVCAGQGRAGTGEQGPKSRDRLWVLRGIIAAVELGGRWWSAGCVVACLQLHSASGLVTLTRILCGLVKESTPTGFWVA